MSFWNKIHELPLNLFRRRSKTPKKNSTLSQPDLTSRQEKELPMTQWAKENSRKIETEQIRGYFQAVIDNKNSAVYTEKSRAYDAIKSIYNLAGRDAYQRNENLYFAPVRTDAELEERKELITLETLINARYNYENSKKISRQTFTEYVEALILNSYNGTSKGGQSYIPQSPGSEMPGAYVTAAGVLHLEAMNKYARDISLPLSRIKAQLETSAA